MRYVVPALLAAVVVLASTSGRDVAAPIPPNGAAECVAFVRVNVVPMTRECILANQTVLVEGDRIVAIGRSGTVAVPESCRVVDGTDAYLLPGLADMHIHTYKEWEAWPAHPMNLFLANGVTTIRNMGSVVGKGHTLEDAMEYTLRLRREVEAGERAGPTILSCGRMLGHYQVSGDLAPREIVRETVSMGFDQLKIYSYIDEEGLVAALEEAEALGLYSIGHIPYRVGLARTLEAGMDEIAHVEELLNELIEFDRTANLEPEAWSTYVSDLGAEQTNGIAPSDRSALTARHEELLSQVISLLDARDTPVCTTMVIDTVIYEKVLDYSAFMARPEIPYMPAEYVRCLRMGRDKHQVQHRGSEHMALVKRQYDRIMLRALHDAGIPLVLGTDAGTGTMGIVPGFSIHDELRALLDSGLSPYDALRTGTVEASRVVERMVGRGDFGTVEVGQRADLILVEGNPLEDLGGLRCPLGVMARGVWYPREELESMAALPD